MSEAGLRYGRMRDEELSAVARILSHAFAGPREASGEWIQKAGLEHMRVVREGGGSGPVLACLLRVPMGAYLGGRRVPLVGIAGVGVSPEARGRGVAAFLMAEAVKEMAAEGSPMSGLYPATQPLYRRVGYEQAGHRFEVRLPIRNIDGGERTMPVRPLREEDHGTVAACYSAFAREFEGPLDRGDYIWRRIREGRDGVVYYGFAAVGESGDVEGYLYVNQVRKPERGRQDLAVSDIAFVTARAGRRMLGFLRDFSSVGDDVVFFGGPSHPLLFLLAEQRYRMELREHWMLRVLDVGRALGARGYRAGDGEVHLAVRDELLPENSGAWVLRVRDGKGEAERGGRGELRLDVGALASLYSGLRSARELALLGRCDGPEAALDAAGAMFAGTTPWLSDMY